MSLKQSITKFFKISLIVLFVGFYSGITLFYHVHVINGQVIAHSHYYKSDASDKTPVKKHTHPLSAYDVIHDLNKMSSEELLATMPYEQPLRIAHSISRNSESANIIISIQFRLPSRAPPVC